MAAEMQRSLDGKAYGDGTPGPVATHIRRLYWDAHESDRYSTPVRYPAG